MAKKMCILQSRFFPLFLHSGYKRPCPAAAIKGRIYIYKWLGLFPVPFNKSPLKGSSFEFNIAITLMEGKVFFSKNSLSTLVCEFWTYSALFFRHIQTETHPKQNTWWASTHLKLVPLLSKKIQLKYLPKLSTLIA